MSTPAPRGLQSAASLSERSNKSGGDLRFAAALGPNLGLAPTNPRTTTPKAGGAFRRIRLQSRASQRPRAIPQRPKRATRQEQLVRWNDRLSEIRAGFEPAFWVANLTELFERLAYYAQAAVLAIFLHESLRLSAQQAGALVGDFGFIVWFLPILGGSLADRFGFRRSLASAYLILAVGYFLMGSLASTWMGPLRNHLPLEWLIRAVLLIPALGPSVVKPCVVGTTARASSESVRSTGYSIYYTLVNIGGMFGPIVAYLVRRSLGIENVFRVSALFVLLMFFATLLFYKEPTRSGDQAVASVAAALRNMFVVLSNLRFVLFLLIFSGFWVIFWQEFIALPLFLRGFVDPNAKIDLLLSVDPATVIVFQIAVSYLTRKIPAFRAMTLGILISSFAWLILLAGTTTPFVVASLFVLALGEITQSPRYYEYISRLAPPGQQGTYMGYAFLPVAIGSLIGGRLGGWAVHYFGDVIHRPQQMWWMISAIGFATTLLMWLYHRIVKPIAAADAASSH
jgi:proton-dependent oligopeptide transporter, POT family